MTDLREKINQEVYEAYQAGIDHNQVPTKYLAMEEGDIRDATDRIIAMFFQALLSDGALNAASRAANAGGDMREIVQAALTFAGITGANTTD